MSEIKIFDHVLKINGQLIECNSNTLSHFTSLGEFSNGNSGQEETEWVSTDGIRGFHSATGKGPELSAFIKRKMTRCNAREVVQLVAKKYKAKISKSICYKQ